MELKPSSVPHEHIKNFKHKKKKAIASIYPEAVVSFSNFDDVPFWVAKAIHEASDSDKRWEDLSTKKQTEKSRKAKRWLNSEAVAAMTPEMLGEIDPDSDVMGWFEQISGMLFTR